MLNGPSEAPAPNPQPSAIAACDDSPGLQEFADSLDEIFMAFDSAERCCGWNRVAAAIFGFSREVVLGRSLREIFHDVDTASFAERVRACVQQRTSESFDCTTQGVLDAHVLRVRIAPARGQVFVFARDVTGERCASAALEARASERESRLREQQHRLKNDLQLVNSMLSKQLRRFDSPEIALVLQEAQNRIRAMAHVHEMLALARSVDEVHAREWVAEIARAVCEAHPEDRRPLLHLAVAPATLSAATADRLGHLVAELMSNALHHAWAGRAPGTLRVTVDVADEQMALTVEDDGVGLPAQPVPGRLGLCLAVQFARQLGGRLELTSPRGTRARVVFPRGSRR